MAYSFAGGSDEIKYANLGILGGSPTIGACVLRFKTTQTLANTLLFSFWNEVNSREGFGILLNNLLNKLTVIAYDVSTNTIAIVGTTTVNDGNWHTLVYNWNGNSGGSNQLFADGISQGSQNSISSWVIGIGGTASPIIGKTNNTFWGAYVGSACELALYNRQLLTDEITALNTIACGAVAKSALIFYAPLVNPQRDRYHQGLTIGGSPALVDSPRLITPTV